MHFERWRTPQANTLCFRCVERLPNNEEKLWDVVGLYLDPPDRTLVLCCDEKRLDEKAEEAAIEGVGKLDAL